MPDDLPWVLTFARSAMLSTFSLFTASCLVDKVCSITLDDCRNQLHHFFHALHLLLVSDTIFVSATSII